MGDVISELGKLREELLDGWMVPQMLPPGVQRPCLDSVQNDTKWLIFQGHFQIAPGAPPNKFTNHLPEVSCHGKTGKELPNYKGWHCVFVGAFCQQIGNQMPKHAGSCLKKKVFSTYKKETIQAKCIEAEV
jgi:hypothetical protein